MTSVTAPSRRKKPAPPIIPLAFRKFPKKLPCLVCGRRRRSTWAGDRIHPACNRARSGVIDEYAMTMVNPHYHRRDGAE